MNTPDFSAPERLRFEGESYVLDDSAEHRHEGVKVVRQDTYDALVRELERLRGRNPTAVYKSTTVRGRP